MDMVARAPAGAPFAILWNEELTADPAMTGAWRGLLAACRRPALSQCLDYGLARARRSGGRLDIGLILFHGRPVGRLMVEIQPVGRLFEIARLYRGQLWVYDEIPGRMLEIVLRLIRARYRLRRRRLLLFHPELPATPGNARLMRRCGFVRRGGAGYRTIRCDLSTDTAAMRARLRGNWRAALGKAERAGLDLSITFGAALPNADFDWLLANESRQRQERGYIGPTPALLRAFAAKPGEEPGEVRLYLAVARAAGTPVAGVILAGHGRAASYLMGWTGEAGRRLSAHHLLLWRMMGHLAGAGHCWALSTLSS